MTRVNDLEDEKLTYNLPFEVVAVPQYDDAMSSADNAAPINVKIRVRNKEAAGNKHGIISLPKLSTYSNGKKVRLINSDQTIMSFNFFTETDTSKTDQKKNPKNIFHMFKRGGRLKVKNRNDNEDLPRSADLDDESKVKSPVTTDDEQINIIKGKIHLKKNFTLNNDILSRTPPIFMGKCKPGGCLDPPFNEDYYLYGPTAKESTGSLYIKKYTDFNIKKCDDNGISSGDINSEHEKLKTKNEKYTKYQVDTYDDHDQTNSLITYPPTSLSNENIRKGSQDFKFKSRISNEDKARISVSEFSDIYFMPPKKERTRTSKTYNDIDEKTNYKTSDESKINNSNLLNDPQILFTPIKYKETVKNSKESLKSTEIAKLTTTSFPPNVQPEYFNKDSIKSFMTKEDVSLKDIHTPEYEKGNDVDFYKHPSKLLNELMDTETNLTTDVDIILDQKSKEYDDSYKDVNNISETKAEQVYFKSLKDLDKLTIDSDTPVKTSENLDILVKRSLESNDSNEIDEINDISNKVLRESKELKNSLGISHQLEVKENKMSEIEVITDSVAETKISEEQEHVLKQQRTTEMNDIVDSGMITAESDVQLLIPESYMSFKSKESEVTGYEKIADISSKTSRDYSKISNELLKMEVTQIGNDVRKSLNNNILLAKDDPTKQPDHFEEVSYIPDTKTSSLTKEGINNINEYIQKLDLDSEVTPTKVAHLFEKSNKGINNQVKKMSDYDTLKPLSVSSKESEGYNDSKINVFEKEKTTDTLTNDGILRPEQQDDTKVIKDIESISDNTNISNINKSLIISLSLPSFRDKEEIGFNSDIKKSLSNLEKSTPKSSLIGSQNELNFGQKNTRDGSSLTNEDSVIMSDRKSLEKNVSESFSIDQKRKSEPMEEISLVNNDEAAINTKITDDLNLVDASKISKELNEKSNINIKPILDDFSKISTHSIAIDFKFRSLIDDNKLVLTTLDPTTLKDEPRDNVTVIKSIIRENDEEIRLPVNKDTDLILQIRKNKEKRKSTLDFEKDIIENANETTHKDYLLQETLNSVYQSLIPLESIIKDLKEEANLLSLQQNSFKKLLRVVDSKPMRLIETEPSCGCTDKQNIHFYKIIP